MLWPEEPKDVGDAYLLVDYLFRGTCEGILGEGNAYLAFALHMDHPADSNKWVWALIADDGDIYLWNDSIPAEEILLIRRAREGLRELIPEKYRESAWRDPA